MVAQEAIERPVDRRIRVPDHVRADFDKFWFDCVSPAHIKRVFPDAYIWEYSSDGDWGGFYEHFLVIRLSLCMALVIMERYDADDGDYVRRVSLQWLRPEYQTYATIAFWSNQEDDDVQLPSHDGWEYNRGNMSEPVWIDDEIVESLDCWRQRWQLGNAYAMLMPGDDTVWEDRAR